MVTTIKPQLVCFKGRVLGLAHQHEGRAVFGMAQLMDYITTSRVHCPLCGETVNPSLEFPHFPVFGNPEALFGMDVWMGQKDLPATTHPQVVSWDIGVELPYDGRIIYANITQNPGDFSNEPPCLLLWNQSPHQPWPTHLRFYVPRVPTGELSV